MRSRVWLVGVLLTAAATAACDDDNDPTGMNNQVPTAQVVADRSSVPLGDNFQTLVTLDATASSDPDGDALTFSWVVPSGRFENGTTATDALIEVTFPGAAPYTVTVTVDDGNGGQDGASVTIGVS